MKDGEIQRLQASLQERQTNDQSDLIDNLRTDLQNMIEKNQRSMFCCCQLDDWTVITVFKWPLKMSFSLVCKLHVFPYLPNVKRKYMDSTAGIDSHIKKAKLNKIKAS